MARYGDTWARCAEDECNEAAHGQGLCRVHYMRAYRARLKELGLKKFDGKMEPFNVDAYWEWVKKELKIVERN